MSLKRLVSLLVIALVVWWAGANFGLMSAIKRATTGGALSADAVSGNFNPLRIGASVSGARYGTLARAESASNGAQTLRPDQVTVSVDSLTLTPGLLTIFTDTLTGELDLSVLQTGIVQSSEWVVSDTTVVETGSAIAEATLSTTLGDTKEAQVFDLQLLDVILADDLPQGVRELQSVTASGTVAFREPIRIQSRELPVFEALTLTASDFLWSDARIEISGTAARNAGCQIDAQFDVTITGWERVIDGLVAVGVLPSHVAQGWKQMGAGLKNGLGEVKLPLSARAGTLRFGPFPIGPAPRLC